MRKLFLASFSFKTGDLQCNEQRLVVLTDQDKKMYNHPVHGGWTEQEIATEKAKVWFEKTFTESEMISIMAHEAIDEVIPNEHQAPTTVSLSSKLLKIGSKYPNFYQRNDLPPSCGDGLSIDVLIDVDGTRTKFICGWYDFTDKEWTSDVDKSVIISEKMEWTYLPLNYQSLNLKERR